MFRINSHIKSIGKAITYRLIGATYTFIATFLLTGRLGVAGTVVGLEVITKTALFYGHERAWELVTTNN